MAYMQPKVDFNTSLWIQRAGISGVKYLTLDRILWKFYT